MLLYKRNTFITLLLFLEEMKISVNPILNTTGNPLGKIVWFTTLFLHIALVFIFLGIWSTIPSYVQVFSNWIHFIVGIYLVIRFHPYQSKIEFHNYDRIIICSSGIFMLQALLASSLFLSPWGIPITNYLQNWGGQLKQKYSWMVGKKTSEEVWKKKKNNDDDDKSPNPNSTTSSLGGSSYSLMEEEKKGVIG